MDSPSKSPGASDDHHRRDSTISGAAVRIGPNTPGSHRMSIYDGKTVYDEDDEYDESPETPSIVEPSSGLAPPMTSPEESVSIISSLAHEAKEIKPEESVSIISSVAHQHDEAFTGEGDGAGGLKPAEIEDEPTNSLDIPSPPAGTESSASISIISSVAASSKQKSPEKQPSTDGAVSKSRSRSSSQQKSSDDKIVRIPTSSSHPHLKKESSVSSVKDGEKAAATASPQKSGASPKRRKSLSELPPETPESLMNEMAYEYQCYRELAYWAKFEEDEIIARVDGGRLISEHVEKLYDDMCPESICFRMIQETIQEEEEERAELEEQNALAEPIIEEVEEDPRNIREERPVSFSEPVFKHARHSPNYASERFGERRKDGAEFEEVQLVDGEGVTIKIESASSASSFLSAASHLSSTTTAGSSFGVFMRTGSGRSASGGSRPPSLGSTRNQVNFSLSVDSAKQQAASSASSSSTTSASKNPPRSSSFEHLKFSALKQKMGNFVHAIASKGIHHHHHHHHGSGHPHYSLQVHGHHSGDHSNRSSTSSASYSSGSADVVDGKRVRRHSGPAELDSPLVYDAKHDIWVTTSELAASKRRCLTRARSEDVGVVPLIVTEDVDSQQGGSGRGRRGSLDSGNMQGAPPMPIPGHSGPSSLGILTGARPRAGTWSIPSGYRNRNASGHGSSSSVASVRGGEEVVKSPVVNRRSHLATAFTEAFRPRSKSDASKERSKKPGLISSMKQSLQSTLSQPGGNTRCSGSGGNLTPHWSEEGQDVTRPRSGSDGHYIHGRGAAHHQVHQPHSQGHAPVHHQHSLGPFSSSTSSYRSPVAKMFDSVFGSSRNRSNSVVTAEEKRKIIPQKSVPPAFLPHHHHAARRHSAFPSGERRGSLGSSEDRHSAMLFRDARGLPHADPFFEKTELEDLEGDESQIYVKFFRFQKCYDLIPTSAKLVVFDTQLQVKKAFYALVYNGVRAAPLWDSEKQKFCGMLTITDFIRILQKYYKSPGKHITELEDHKLATWRSDLAYSFAPLVSIAPDASLFEAIQRLIQYRIHRLPVIDPATGDVLYIVTHKRIFRFLCLHLHELPRPSYLDKTLEELNIGSFDNVAVANESTPIIEALKLFIDRRVSALPVLDEHGKLRNIYAKFDVINLAASKTYDNLDMTLKEANAHRRDWFEGVQTCSKTDTLGNVMEKIAKAEVHRLVVVDKDNFVIGVVSLSDILKFLVLDPAAKLDDSLKVSDACEEATAHSEDGALTKSQAAASNGDDADGSSPASSSPPTTARAKPTSNGAPGGALKKKQCGGDSPAAIDGSPKHEIAVGGNGD